MRSFTCFKTQGLVAPKLIFFVEVMTRSEKRFRVLPKKQKGSQYQTEITVQQCMVFQIYNRRLAHPSCMQIERAKNILYIHKNDLFNSLENHRKSLPHFHLLQAIVQFSEVILCQISILTFENTCLPESIGLFLAKSRKIVYDRLLWLNSYRAI